MFHSSTDKGSCGQLKCIHYRYIALRQQGKGRLLKTTSAISSWNFFLYATENQSWAGAFFRLHACAFALLGEALRPCAFALFFLPLISRSCVRAFALPRSLIFRGLFLHFSIFRAFFALLDFCARTFANLDFRARNFVLVYIRLGRDSQNNTPRTGQAEQDRHNRIGRTGQAEQDRQNRSGGTGQAEQDRQNKTEIAGQAEKDRQNMTGTIGLLRQDLTACVSSPVSFPLCLYNMPTELYILLKAHAFPLPSRFVL